MERTLTRLLGGLRQHRRSLHLWALAAPIMAAAMLVSAAVAEQPVPQDLEFKIVREGDDIGHHRITFRKDAEKLVVRSDLKLVALTSVANDDGTFYDIKGQAGPNGLRVTSRGKSWTLPADSVPASYWNVSMVTTRSSPLIDAQSGTILDATVKKIGQERIWAGGKEVVATHYRLGTKRPRDLWYDAQGRWVKMRAKGSDGSVAEWVLE